MRLEPLHLRHASDLSRIVNQHTFQHFAAVRPPSWDAEGVEHFINQVNSLKDTVGFAMVLVETGEAVGSTTYMDIRPPHRGLEIGMTWIAEPYRGTFVNPEVKFLMLQHAFESIGCVRVQLKCDARNTRSQAAILKLGAKFEGRLRKHFVLPDGFIRDTMMYSITAEEWPELRERLSVRIAST